MTPARSTFWGSASSASIGVAFLVLTPRLFELDHGAQPHGLHDHGDPGAEPGAHLGLRRHPVLRPGRLLRPRRLCLRDRRCQYRRDHGPVLLAIVLPAVFAALLGYFIFYGRISDVYLGVITLTVTLILFNSVNSTSGPEYQIGIGAARRLQRHPRHAAAQYPCNKASPIDLEGMFYLATVVAAAGLFRSAAAAGQPLRPRHRRHPRERAARRAAGLRSARLQARDLHHRRRDRRPRRLPLRQLGPFVSPTSSACRSRRRSSSG